MLMSIPHAQRDRPRAPYLSRPAMHHSSRPRPYPISTAASERDGRAEACSPRPNGVQSSANVSAPRGDAAAVPGQHRHQRSALRGDRQTARAIRVNTQVAGVIDLTADESASPASATDSDCVIADQASSAGGDARARAATLTRTSANVTTTARAAATAQAAAETRSNSHTVDPAHPQEGAQSAVSAFPATAQSGETPDAALPQNDGRWGASRALVRPILGNVHSSRSGQDQTADCSESASRQPAAQAVPASGRHSRWDVMPQHISSAVSKAQPSSASPGHAGSHVRSSTTCGNDLARVETPRHVLEHTVQNRHKDHFQDEFRHGGQHQNRAEDREGLHSASWDMPKSQRHHTVANDGVMLSRQSSGHTRHSRKRHRQSTRRHRLDHSVCSSHDGDHKQRHDHGRVEFDRPGSDDPSSRHRRKQARGNVDLPHNSGAQLLAERLSHTPFVEPDDSADRVGMLLPGQDDRWQMWHPHNE